MTAQRFDTDQTGFSLGEGPETSIAQDSDPVASPVFDDGKDPEALRTIGEVAKALGIRQHVLRYWEEQFPTMLRPVKRSGNRRYYRPEDVTLIARIDQLVHREGYTLKGAAKALAGAAKSARKAEVRKPAAAAISGAAVSAVPVSPDFVAQLSELRDRLSRALEAA